ncbi:MAG: hypothetical protein ACRD7E_18540 [Bryobacteraceae bacterium]
MKHRLFAGSFFGWNYSLFPQFCKYDPYNPWLLLEKVIRLRVSG